MTAFSKMLEKDGLHEEGVVSCIAFDNIKHAHRMVQEGSFAFAKHYVQGLPSSESVSKKAATSAQFLLLSTLNITISR